MENVNDPNFYHKDVLEEVLEILERKYEKMKVNLKNYEINTQLRLHLVNLLLCFFSNDVESEESILFF